MIELTTEQQPEFDAANNTTANVADIPVGILEARAAFRRDLPGLLANRRMRGKYVCYHKTGLAAMARDYRGIIDEFNRHGFQQNEYLIEKIVEGDRPDEEEIEGRSIEFDEEPS